MKKAKKALALVLCAVLLVAGSVMGTLAYLTSTTGPVENTFTVGQVKITLDEAKVDNNGKEIEGASASRVTENSYKLMPGHTYDKDPTIHVDSSSSDCFIRAKVTLTNAQAWMTLIQKYANGDITQVFTGFNENLWWVDSNSASLAADGSLTYTFVYKNESKEESLKRVWQNGVDSNNLVLFNEIVMPGGLTNEEIATVANTKITVTAQAIQADGFAEDSNDATKAAEAYSKAMAALDTQIQG